MDIFKQELEKAYSSAGIKSKSKVISMSRHQTGRTTKSVDVPRKALLPGKRMSRTGKIYYEYRKNRSDMPGTNL